MLLGKIYIFLFLWVCLLGSELPTVQTPNGKIKGYYKLSYGGRTFSAFEGIPYAKPPVGDLRFEEPQETEPWIGIWNATVMHTCIQVNIQTSHLEGSEDCLYINVYVPSTKPTTNDNFDVIVHIHGGAFIVGSPDMAGPDFIMDRDVVYIHFNYRLGAFGFLSTEDEIVPGNNGMKDQVFALRWIQDNIKYFGGNPKSVTIIGLSAGGASVHLHYFSPLSKGLFNRGISQSGTALNPWVIQEAPLQKTKKLAASVGCDSLSTKQIIDCLRQRSAKQLTENLNQLAAIPGFLLSIFAPVVEKKHKTAFLVQEPKKLLEEGQIYDVPWITSATTEEGIFPAILFLNMLDKINDQWHELMPYLLQYNYNIADSNKVTVGQKIRGFYFGNENISQDNFPTLIKLFGDRDFHIDFEKAARMQAKINKSPVYSLLYGYKGERTIVTMFGATSDYGVCHGDDMLLAYSQSDPSNASAKVELSSSDEKIKELLVDMFVSFAKNSKPKLENVIWKPVVTDSSEFDHLAIHRMGEVNMDVVKEIAPAKFWESLFDSNNQKSLNEEL